VNQSINNELSISDVTMLFQCTVEESLYKQFYNLQNWL